VRIICVKIGTMQKEGVVVFREVARIKNRISEADALDILKKATRGVLSVVTEEGYPYGMPMNHWYEEDDGCIYFHCGRKGHRLDALQENDRVSYCVMDEGRKTDGDWAWIVRSVVVFGRMEVIDDAEAVIRITEKLCHKFTDDEDYIQNEIRNFAHATLLLRLKPEHITGKQVSES